MSAIALSPWSRQALGSVVLAVLEDSAKRLGCTVSTVRNTRHGWVIRVRAVGADHVAVEVRGKGDLAELLASALDRFADTRFTPDELAAIYRQGSAA